MKDYFLPRISSTQKAQLSREGIKFVQFKLNDTERGITVAERDLERSLKILGLYFVKSEESDYVGIHRVTFSRKKTYAVRVENKEHFRRYSWEDFTEVLKKTLSPVIKKDICLDVPHSHTRDPQEDGVFYILIWSSPKGTNSVQTPDRIFGEKVDCTDRSYAPSGMGIPILDDEKYPAAELVGDNLYIHHDICQYGTPSELQMFTKIINAVRRIIKRETNDQREARFAQFIGELRKTQKKEYVQLCEEIREKALSGLNDGVEECRKKASRIQAELTIAIRNLHLAEKKLYSGSKHEKSGAEIFEAEVEKLSRVNGVKSFHVKGDKLIILTEIIYCTNPRDQTVYELGAFKIEISARTSQIFFFNLTRRVRGYNVEMHAPHITADGRACLGTLEEILPDLVGNFEFAAAAAVAIQFLESVNPDDDAGDYISEWPLAPEEMQPRKAA